MSFGFSVTDIVHAAHIAKQIKDIWFTRINRADAHYLQFGRDVGGFEALLNRFEEAFNEYARVREIQLGVGSYRDAELIREKKEQEEQVGGFQDTVRDCSQLLEENGKYLVKRANAWDNAKWHIFSGQERADKLRARLQFHSTKIGVFMQTISVSVQAATHMALRDIRLQIEQLPLRVLSEIAAQLSGRPRKDGLPPILPDLDDLYKSGLQVDKPDAFVDVSSFPLKEGLDALASALEQSTIRLTGSGLGLFHPTVQQLNNLIKARWIFDRMVESSQMREAGRDSLWYWCLETVQYQIKMEYSKHERDIIAEEANIASLGPESFRIWMPPLETTTVSITEADESQHEEKILEVSLVSPPQSRKELIVFRRPKNELRLVTITTPIAQGNAQGMSSAPQSHEDNKVVNLHQVQIVPRYALANERGDLNSRIIELCFPGASSGYSYQFKMDEDLLRFQQALLGYKVVYDNPSCKWAFHRGSTWARPEKTSGQGRVQIWQAKAPPALFGATPRTPSTVVNPSISASSPPKSPPPFWPHSRADSIHSSTTTTTATLRPMLRIPEPHPEHGSIVAFQRPVTPLLVIFTTINKNPTFLVLKLDSSKQIHHQSCDCGSHRESKQLACTRTVLESDPPKREKFKLMQLTIDPNKDVNSHLAYWNLGLFSHGSSTNSRHPGLDSVDKIRGVRWLSIDTITPEQRRGFQEAVTLMGRIRDSLQRRFDHDMQQIERRSERPVQGNRTATALATHAIDGLGFRNSSVFGPEGHLSPRSTPSVRSRSFTTGSVSPGARESRDLEDKEDKSLG